MSALPDWLQSVVVSLEPTREVRVTLSAGGQLPILISDEPVRTIVGVQQFLKGEPGAASTVPGPAGPPGSSYTHMQPSASALWTVNHNLGKKVLCQVYTVGGVQVIAQVVTVSDNQVQVVLDEANSGYAVIS